ncbi:hypothetical protein L9F63_026116, partial [Diploptera punctata]
CDISMTNSSAIDAKRKNQYQRKYDAGLFEVEVLSNASMKPNNLRRHLEAKRSD